MDAGDADDKERIGDVPKLMGFEKQAIFPDFPGIGQVSFRIVVGAYSELEVKETVDGKEAEGQE